MSSSGDSSTRDAARAQRDALAREAAELDEQLAALRTLEDERRALERERESVRSGAVEERRRALKVLGAVKGAGSCSVAWDTLSGDGCLRSCTRCGQPIADPRRLDEKRARMLLAAEGPLYARADGTLMTRPCPRAQRRRSMTRFAVVTSMLLGLFAIDLAIEAYVPPPAATLQYLSPRSRLGRRPSGIARQVPIAPHVSQ
jgi:hypothetical protein